MRRSRNLSVLLILSTLAILLAAMVFVLAGNQDRFGPWLRSLSLPAALLLALVLLIVLPLAVAGLLKQFRRPREEEEPVSPPVPIPDDLTRAAGVQAQALANSSTGSAIRGVKPSWRGSFPSFTPSDSMRSAL